MSLASARNTGSSSFKRCSEIGDSLLLTILNWVSLSIALVMALSLSILLDCTIVQVSTAPFEGQAVHVLDQTLSKKILNPGKVTLNVKAFKRDLSCAAFSWFSTIPSITASVLASEQGQILWELSFENFNNFFVSTLQPCCHFSHSRNWLIDCYDYHRYLSDKFLVYPTTFLVSWILNSLEDRAKVSSSKGLE